MIRSRCFANIVICVCLVSLLVACEKNTIDLNQATANPPAQPDQKPSSTTTTIQDVVTNPTPTPVPVSVNTRIVCESQILSSPSFTTMNQDAASNFFSTDIKITLDNKELPNLQSPLSLVSDGRFIDMYFLGATDSNFNRNEWTLYQADVDIYSRKGIATALFKVPSASGSWGSLLNSRAEVVALARNDQSVLSPDMNKNMRYCLRDLSTGRIIKHFDITSENFGQPQLSIGAKFALLQTTSSLKAPLKLGVVVLNVQDGAISALPALKDSDLQWSAAFSNKDRIFWLEKSDSTISIRTQSSKTNALTIYSEKNPGVLSLSLLETSNGDFQLLLLLEKGIRILKVKSSLAVEKIEDFPAPVSEETITNPVFSPHSLDIYFSRDNKGGLLGFNIKTKRFRQVGYPSSAYKCLYPSVGPELIFKDTP